MRLVIEQQPLAAAIGHAFGSSAKSQAAITSNLLLTVSDGLLLIEGTDLDMVASASVAADVEMSDAPRSITVAAAHLREVVTKSPKGSQVSMAWDADAAAMRVRVGRSSFSLGIITADAWIGFDRGSEYVAVDIDGLRLAEAIRFVRGGAADAGKQGLGFLAGVLFDAEGGLLRLASSDGNALRIADTTAPVVLPILIDGDPVSCVVPNKAAEKIADLAEWAKGTVRVSLDDRKITVATATASLCSKLLESRFPDYRRVIPAPVFRVLSDRSELLGAVQRVAFVASAGNGTMKFAVGEDSIEISCRAMGQETATSAIACELTDHEPFDVLFSHKYVAPTLAALSGDTVEIGMTGVKSPAIFRSVNDPGRFSVISPRNG